MHQLQTQPELNIITPGNPGYEYWNLFVNRLTATSGIQLNTFFLRQLRQVF